MPNSRRLQPASYKCTLNFLETSMIPDQDKTKEQLIAELAELRRKVNPVLQTESAGSPGETRQTIEILKESEERFRIIADYTCDWESWVGLDGNLVWINPAVEKLTGYSREEYSNMPDRLKQIIFNDDREMILSHFENGLKFRLSDNDVEFRIKCKDGSLKWVSLSYQPIHSDTGECLGLRSSIRDINERKQAQEMLLATNVFLDSLMANLPVQVFAKEANEFRYIYWNKACETLIGLKEEEVIGKTDYDVLGGSAADSFTASDRLAVATGEPVFIAAEPVDLPRRGTRDIRTTKVPILNRPGIPPYILGIAEDITDQKLTERALRESEEKYRTLLNDSTDAILLADAEGIIFEANRQAEALLGYTAQEFAGMNFAALLPEQEPNTIIDFVTSTLLPQGFWSLNDVQLLKKDGTLVPADISGRFIEYAGKQVILGTVRNISERKAAEAELDTYRQHLEKQVAARTAELTALNVQLQQEIEEHDKTVEALRRSEEQLRQVIENASDAIVTADSRGNIVLWNKAAENIFGYTAGEMLNKPFIQIMPEQLQESHWQQFTAFLAEGTPGVIVMHAELTARRKDGSEFPAEGSVSLWETREGVFITSLVRDISNRKRAEILLQESEERFRNLAQTATDAIFVTDESRRIVFWNKSAETIFGYTAEEVLDKQSTLVVPDELRAQDEASYQTLVAIGSSPLMGRVFEAFGRHKDGTTFSTEISLSRWQISNKIFFCAITRDITQRKAIEASLQESEEKFRTMTEHITVSIFIYQGQ